MTHKIKQEAHKMFRWVIRTLFDNNPGQSLNLGELKQELGYTWDDMVETGEVVISEEEPKRRDIHEKYREMPKKD